MDWGTVLLGMAVVVGAVPASGQPARPALVLKALTLRTQEGSGAPGIHKRVRVAHPEGWTGELQSDGRSLRLFGPEGEGMMLIAAALHPSQLTPYLKALKNRHPSAAPSPPMALSLPGVRTDLGERATRFVITGKEVGEMVMVEKRGVIVLMVTVVDPNAWEKLMGIMARCYPAIEVEDVASRP